MESEYYEKDDFHFHYNAPPPEHHQQFRHSLPPMRHPRSVRPPRPVRPPPSQASAYPPVYPPPYRPPVRPTRPTRPPVGQYAPRKPRSYSGPTAGYRPPLIPDSRPRGPLRHTSPVPRPAVPRARMPGGPRYNNDNKQTLKRKLPNQVDNNENVPVKAAHYENELAVESMMQPLYCKMCSLKLNSPSQATLHYQGKAHAKKRKQFTESNGSSAVNIQAAVAVTQQGPSLLPLPGGPVGPGSVSNNVKHFQPPALKPDVKIPPSVAPPPPAPVPAVCSVSEASRDTFCKLCDVSFNSPQQADQHYGGKNHAKKMKIVPSNVVKNEPAPSQPSKTSKFMCSVCSINVTSEEQLEMHLKGIKHLNKVKIQERSQAALQGPWGRTIGSNTGPGQKLFNIPSLPSQAGPVSTSSPPKKKRQDLSMYRTPSGSFYCHMCNAQVSNEQQFSQHVESKKHKSNNASRRADSMWTSFEK